MATVTIYELFDILNAEGSLDLSISATDKDGTTQSLISSDNAKRWILRNYPTRKYQILKGAEVTVSEAKADFNEWFRLWISNRQRGIDKQYQALFDYDFSPIENYDRYENETIDKNGTFTHGRKDTHSGSDKTVTGSKTQTADTGTVTDVREETDNITRGGTDSTIQNGTIIHETDRAGFNSPQSYTNSERVTDTYNGKTDTTTHDMIDTTNIQDSNTETRNLNTITSDEGETTTTHGEVITASGTDSTSDDSIRELHSHGNIGVTTSQAMIKETIDLYSMSLVEMILTNFIDDSTFYS